MREKQDMKYICDYYVISRAQRSKEKTAGLGEAGTQGYEDKGCYKCLGINPLCMTYQDELKIVRSEVNSRLLIACK